MKVETIIALTKAGAGGALYWLALKTGNPVEPQTVIFTREMTTAYLGVPFNVVVACAAGAYASFSFGDPVQPRSKMFQLWLACVFMGSAITGVTNVSLEHWAGLKLADGAQAGMGAIISCLARFVIPSVIDAIRSGEWKSWIPFMRNRNGE